MNTNNLKRNELDIIITDLLPVEISKIFTYNNFYNYLFKKNKEIKKLELSLKKIKYSGTTIFGSRFHATPLKYKVDKGNGSLREISVVNPFSSIQIYCFLKLYNEDIFYHLGHKNHFSIRYHQKNTSLFYLESKKGLVKYEGVQKKNKFIRALESTGVFYNIKPFPLIGTFYNSDLWFDANNKYNFFGKLDYKDCFGSIYTHTYKWIIADNTIDSKNLKNNHIFTTVDKLLQNINSSISNGIIVGPEFTRMIAELLLQKIDEEVFQKLLIEGFRKSIDYEIYRYVDDIYIFAKDEKIVALIKELFTEGSSKYQLKLNELKSLSGKLPYLWNEWKEVIIEYQNNFFNRFFYSYKDGNEYLVKSIKFLKRNNSSLMKENFLNLISKNNEYKNKIISYFLTSLFNKFADNEGKLFRKNVSNNEIVKILDYILFVFSFSPTYRNTQKLISLIYVIQKEVHEDKVVVILKDLFRKYEYIFLNANFEDISDILYILASKGIELPTITEEHLWGKMKNKQNPIMIAIFLIYSKYNRNFFNKIKAETEEMIKSKISIITSKENILLYKELWWLFTFINCPYISEETNKKINEKIKLLKADQNEVSDQIQNIIYDFLIEQSFKDKFINWDHNYDDLLKDITYYTYERTIFRNPINLVEGDY